MAPRNANTPMAHCPAVPLLPRARLDRCYDRRGAFYQWQQASLLLPARLTTVLNCSAANSVYFAETVLRACSRKKSHTGLPTSTSSVWGAGRCASCDNLASYSLGGERGQIQRRRGRRSTHEGGSSAELALHWVLLLVVAGLRFGACIVRHRRVLINDAFAQPSDAHSALSATLRFGFAFRWSGRHSRARRVFTPLSEYTPLVFKQKQASIYTRTGHRTCAGTRNDE